MKTFFDLLKCFFSGHAWTSKAQQGIKPYPGETFKSYAEMYCGRCGTRSKLNKRIAD